MSIRQILHINRPKAVLVEKARSLKQAFLRGLCGPEQQLPYCGPCRKPRNSRGQRSPDLTFVRKTILYSIIIIYSFALLRPIVPVVNDVLAHAFNKMEHMATIHYENGDYHIHAELAQAADDDENVPVKFSTEKMEVHVVASPVNEPVYTADAIRWMSSSFDLPPTNIPELPAPPPRC